MIKRHVEEIKGVGKIIPKGITIDNQKQDIKTYETININKDSLDFQKHWKVNLDYVTQDGRKTKSPQWYTDTRFKMAPAGSSGGGGGSVANDAAVSRIEVMDPHLLQMMRDVMDASDNAVRLNPQGQATGGGGGGGGGTGSPPGTANGSAGGSGTAVSNCIVSSTQGEGGNGGTSSNIAIDGAYPGGAGGGGAGGGGGVVVICTTTAEGSFLSSNVVVSGGRGGQGGDGAFGGSGTNGGQGDNGTSGTKLWIQI